MPVVIVRNFMEYFMKVYTYNKFSFGEVARMLEMVMGKF